MRSTRILNSMLALAAGFCLTISAFAQDRTTTRTDTQDQTTQPVTQTSHANQTTDQTRQMRITPGQKQKITGVIVKRDPDSSIIRDQAGMEVTVNLNNTTRVTERKSNPFRRAKNYDTTALLRGLQIEAEGRGDNSGALNADKIKFTDDEFRVARSIETRVTPGEGRVTDAETRLTSAEQNAQRLSGQIDELGQVTTGLKEDINAVQNTANAAMAGVNATNERISMLDDYEARQNMAVNFKVGSAVLSPEAKASLDQIATQAMNEKAFIIQVTGFASADGNEEMNRRLSQRRADAVVRYLVENHNIPLRRIITPFGYGEANPVADNTTREGREQNRRVEVAILVNKGLTAPAPATTGAAETSSDTTRARTANPRP